MQSVDWTFRVVAVKEEEILYRLLSLAQDIDNILSELATKERRDWSNLASDVLEEASQEFTSQRLGRELQLLVFFGGKSGKDF